MQISDPTTASNDGDEAAVRAAGGLPLLVVDGLTVDLPKLGRMIRIVDGVSFRVARAERVALVGESGSGKTVTAQSLLRLNRRAAVRGRVIFEGHDLASMPEPELAKIRGTGIGMAFQDAMTSLNPIMTIGDQVMETLTIHGASRAAARAQAIKILDELGVARAAERLNAYVHEFSGGMRQRVVLAMALAGNPRLLIADEPTTALDVRVQQQVLDVLDRIALDRALSVILITHDLGIVASFADRVMVMYAGRIVEDAAVRDLFKTPLHPYTAGLLAAVPRVDRRTARLPVVPGAPAPPTARPSGCAFHPRCPLATDTCRTTTPELRAIGPRRVACHRAGEIRNAGHAA